MRRKVAADTREGPVDLRSGKQVSRQANRTRGSVPLGHTIRHVYSRQSSVWTYKSFLMLSALPCPAFPFSSNLRRIKIFQYVEGIARLQFGAKSAFFARDSDSAQIAYSHSSMSICAETEPAQKSSDLASKASFATPSVFFY